MKIFRRTNILLILSLLVISIQVDGQTIQGTPEAMLVLNTTTSSTSKIMDLSTNFEEKGILILPNRLLVGGDEWIEAYSGNQESDVRNYQLVVDGNFIAKKIAVAGDLKSFKWPDYVFAKDYELPALSTVEAFIQKEKHLPEVPSAKEIKKDGLDLGKMDATLLKKVEELTLYTIAQEKKIDALTKIVSDQKQQLQEMDELKKRLEQLEALLAKDNK